MQHEKHKFFSYSIIILTEKTQEIYSRIYLGFFDPTEHFTVPIKRDRRARNS